MTTIYVDRAVMLDDTHGVQGFSEGAIRSLGFLREAGHDIVIVATPSGGSPADEPAGDWTSIPIEAIPTKPAEPAWYLTSDADRCQGRSALLKTVLIGAAPAPAAIHRCDAMSRDVSAAVLEILSAEAMRS